MFIVLPKTLMTITCLHFSSLFTHTYLLVKQPIDPNHWSQASTGYALLHGRLSQQPYPRCFLEQCWKREWVKNGSGYVLSHGFLYHWWKKSCSNSELWSRFAQLLSAVIVKDWKKTRTRAGDLLVVNPHTPGRYPGRFANSFCLDILLFVGVKGEVWGIFPGYVNKIIETWCDPTKLNLT